MRIQPVKLVGIMTFLIGIAAVALPIVSWLEGKEGAGWHFAVLYLFGAIGVVYAALKHMQKRIDFLEEQLNQK